MKKFLSLMLFVVMAITANAQDRKYWDFRTLSDETIADIVADPDTWTVTNKDDGSFDRASDAKKISGVLKANGNPIKELQGLTFGSAGLSKNNNFMIATNRFRMTRDKMEIIFPKLAPGQTVTIRARSANSTATNRGFAAGNDNLEYISGPKDGICLGNKAEGYGGEDCPVDQDGNCTLVWKVKEDLDADSVDVVIKLKTGGLDMAEIYIDNGNDPSLNKKKIGYFYTGELNADAAYSIISADAANEVIAIDVAGDLSAITADSLKGFEVTVISNSVPADNGIVAVLKEAMPWTPMLNLNANMYAAWGYGEGITSLDVVANATKSKNSLFKDITFITDESMPDVYGLIFEPLIGVKLGDYFANDEILAVDLSDPTVTAIHAHNINHNGYLYIPYSEASLTNDPNIQTLLKNAVNELSDSKAKISNVTKPTFEFDYKSGSTDVYIKCINAKASIYYTIDGSEPTAASTLYTGPFNVTTETTVKAVSIAEGYLPSEVVTEVAAIKELMPQPTIQIAQESGLSTITLVPATEGDSIYYNFTGSEEITASSVYEGPIALTKHCTITAFTAPKGINLQSETVSQDVTVIDEKIRIDVVSHMDAGSAYNVTTYKNGYNFYTDEVISEDITYDENGEPVLSIVYKPANIMSTIDPGTDWILKTWGQPITYLKGTTTQNVGDCNGYNPDRAEDLIDLEVTSNAVQLSAVKGTDGNGVKDPASASIESKIAFQAPFDIVTYVGGAKALCKVLVSTDTTDVNNWKEIGEVHGVQKTYMDSSDKDRTGRMWRKQMLSYEGTDMVFVKFASDGRLANIYNIIIKNQGEKSNDYIANGIENIESGNEDASEVVRTIVYSINGAQLDKAGKGVNIIKKIYANGKVKTSKVVLK